MNYQALKAMIESVTGNYKCPSCGSQVDESALDIIGAAGSTINIDIACPNCEKHSMIKAEVMQLDVTNMKIDPSQIEALKSKIGEMAGLIPGQVKIETQKGGGIKDENIIDLNKNLQQKELKVEDLFSD